MTTSTQYNAGRARAETVIRVWETLPDSYRNTMTFTQFADLQGNAPLRSDTLDFKDGYDNRIQEKEATL